MSTTVSQELSWFDISLSKNLLVLEGRKADPSGKKDILNMMINGVDKETGQKLSEDSIKKNVSSSISPLFGREAKS